MFFGSLLNCAMTEKCVIEKHSNHKCLQVAHLTVELLKSLLGLTVMRVVLNSAT